MLITRQTSTPCFADGAYIDVLSFMCGSVRVHVQIRVSVHVLWNTLARNRTSGSQDLIDSKLRGGKRLPTNHRHTTFCRHVYIQTHRDIEGGCVNAKERVKPIIKEYAARVKEKPFSRLLLTQSYDLGHPKMLKIQRGQGVEGAQEGEKEKTRVWQRN